MKDRLRGRRSSGGLEGAFDALVTEAHTRAAIAGLRALGRSGLAVVGLAPTRASAGLRSRYCSLSTTGPGVLRDPAAFAARVAELARAHGPLTVYPVQEEAIDALFEASPALPPEVRLPYAGPGPLRILRDKRALPDLAADAGLTTPRVFAEGTSAKLVEIAVPLPSMIKPVGKGGAIKRPVAVRSDGERRAMLESMPADEPLLVQERLAGPVIGLAVVIDRDGRLVARFQQISRRTWPPDAGGSSVAVSVAPDDRLASRVVELLKGAGFWGLAQVQFIESARGPILIDVNPRFYGSMALACASGVNLAAAWHAVAGDRRPDPLGNYRVGVTYRWLEADVVAALRGSPGLLLRRAPAPRVGPFWAADDPLPGLAYAADFVRHGVGKRLHRAGAPR